MNDVEELSDRCRELLVLIAEQSGYTDTGTDTDSDTDTVRDGGETVTVCTTRSLTDATGLDNSKINYDLKKLTGQNAQGVGEPLVNTIQQGMNNSGLNRPKRIELTDAGKQAIDDDVIERDRLHTGPDWFPDDDSPSDQLRAIAERLDAHETVLDTLTTHIGYTNMTTLTDSTVNGDAVTRDTIVTGPGTANDMTVLENLNRVAQGHKAIVKALQEAGANIPDEYLERDE